MATDGYPIPAKTTRIETRVVNSRFIASLAYTPSVEEAKAFIAQIRAEMPDATHHVYAFKVGYGSSVIEGMSDDGEPSGTSGPPVLAILRGEDIGDTVIVVTRYFGGTKLGTGGLVRAYSGAAREVLDRTPRTLKIPMVTIGLDLPYTYYEQVERLLAQHDAEIEDQTFDAQVSIIAHLPRVNVEPLSLAISELTAGKVSPVIF